MWCLLINSYYSYYFINFHVHVSLLTTMFRRKLEATPPCCQRLFSVIIERWSVVFVRYWFFSSIPFSVLKPRFLRSHGTSSGTSVLVPTSRYQGFGTRFSGGYLQILNFGTGSIHFGFRPTLVVRELWVDSVVFIDKRVILSRVQQKP